MFALSACGSSEKPPGSDGPPANGDCGTVINADITVSTRLVSSGAGCDYLVDGDLEVKALLTVDPGTVVEFTRDSRLFFTGGGALQALGTAGARITLRGQQDVRGYWYGLCFSENGPSRLEHVDLLHGGKVYNTLTYACSGAIGGVTRMQNGVSGAPVDIVDSLVAGSYGDGLNATRVNLGEFARNNFADNGGYGVRVYAGLASRLDSASDYLGTSVKDSDGNTYGNGKPYVFLDGRLDTPGVTHHWRALNAPWLVGGDQVSFYRNYVRIFDGTQVVIEAGARFLFSPGSDFRVSDGSTLTAIGTADDPIVFAGTSGQRGSWEGISVASAGTTMQYVAILNGGQEGLFPGALAIYGVNTSQHSTLDNVIISGSAACGLMLDSPYTDGLVSATNMMYEDNARDFCPARR